MQFLPIKGRFCTAPATLSGSETFAFPTSVEKAVDPVDEKKMLRKRLRAVRAGLDPEVRMAGSLRIMAHLEELDIVQSASTVLLYLGCGTEVLTHPLAARLLAQDKCVLAPRRAPERQLEWVALARGEVPTSAPSELLEPVGSRFDPPFCRQDVVLVPGLGFTAQGARLGQGGGYYDRFLAQFPGIRIGLAFEPQLLDTLPEEEFDQRMDCVVTEDAVHWCA